MTHRRFTVLVLLLLVGNALPLSAQKKIKWEGKKFQAVTITDPGELYSTPDFTESEISQLKAVGKLSQHHVDLIMANYHESQWTNKMNNLDNRIENPGIIMRLKVYKVAKVEDRYVLYVPVKGNGNLPEGWVVTKGFFIVIGTSGVSG
jgi:hypothetical protein